MEPILSPPVARPDLVHAWKAVDVSSGSFGSLLHVFMHLTHGANYNDPSPWQANTFMARKGSR